MRIDEIGIVKSIMKNDIKISIITICYNAENLIEKTIKSVIEQDYCNVEYIIVDGKSNDDTMSIVRKYVRNIDVVISETDRGISDAFNKGIRKSTGDYICFLNAGDVFTSNAVLSHVAADLLSYSSSDVVFYKMKYGANFVTPSNVFNNDAEQIWMHMQIPHQACFCKHSLFENIGYFNLLLKIRMDYEFFARCVKLNVTYHYIPEVITQYDDTGVSSQISNKFLFFHEGLLVKNFYGFPVMFREKLRCLKWWFKCKIRR